jgi:hypothetical protein
LVDVIPLPPLLNHKKPLFSAAWLTQASRMNKDDGRIAYGRGFDPRLSSTVTSGT